jgi:hypothetical protein
MGSKLKCFFLGLLFFNLAANAQTGIDFQSVDSLTYKYYKSGDWNNLIKLGTVAIDNGIDYKYLWQRMGFAFFSKGDYIQSRKHFEKALTYDSSDTFTITYLYYSYLYAGQSQYARFFESKMADDLRKSLSVKSFQPVGSIDFEYSFKYAVTDSRSNPQYYHFGINSLLGPRLELYQMYSHYNQTIKVQNKNVKDQQPEYYALLKFTFSPHWMAGSAFHYLNTTYNRVTSSAYLGWLEFSANYDRFNFGVNTSVLKSEQYSVLQSGIKAGVGFTGNLNMYFTSALSLTNKQNTSRLIYDQTAGFKLLKKVWLEGNITLGNLSYYHDHEAMYIYNLIDPTTFRAGATLFTYSGKHITLWTNFSYELKEYYENNLYNYNQFCYLGGVKWKL